MPKLSVCIDAVFSADPLKGLERLPALGYGAFEFWGWWNREQKALRDAKERLGLEVSTFCTRMVSLAEPEKRREYVEGLRESLEVAGRLGCRRLITQTGQDTGRPREEQHRSLAEGLRACAPLLEESGVTLLVEPLNLIDHPGYYLVHAQEAFDLVDEVGSPCVKVLYDIYHQQISEGDILRNIEPNIAKIGHFHAAGNPGRHELATGELHYGNIFKELDRMGYSGYVGLEYYPAAPAEEGLAQALALAGGR